MPLHLHGRIRGCDLQISRSVYCLLRSQPPFQNPLKALSARNNSIETDIFPSSSRRAQGGAQGGTKLCSNTCSMTVAGDSFFLDEFALRQWDDPNYSGTRISYSKDGFVRKVHDYHSKVKAQHQTL